MRVEWPAFQFPPINLWVVWPSKDMQEVNRETAVSKESKGFTNYKCSYYPCHDIGTFKKPEEFNCLFCNCPLYWLECPGNYNVITDVDGVARKDCSECKIPHDGWEKSWKVMNLSKYQTKPIYWSGK